MKKNLSYLCVSIISALGGWFLHAKAVHLQPKVEREYQSVVQSLVNPLLDCTDTNLVHKELRPFEEKIEDMVQDRIHRGAAQNIAVYFRDLNNGPWIGVNEDYKFAPASLLKIPVAISYYLYAQTEKDIFEKQLTWTGSHASEQTEASTLIPGTSYTVRELIRRMLTLSDNAATYLLTSNLPPEILLKPYKDLGLDIPSRSEKEYEISVRNYAKIIRILYNASYLNRSESEEILTALSLSEFTEGLRAGVPRSIPIANKYGRRNHQSYTEFHDCGIIYYPGAPYLLCIMTKGQDLDRMGDAIQSISALVYKEVQSQRMGAR